MNASAPSAAPPEPAARRVECLDAFRGAAALWVLWFHIYVVVYDAGKASVQPHAAAPAASAAPAPPAASTAGFLASLPLCYGDTGVALFFVLSGFVIHYSTLRAAKLDVLAFFWRRFWRLYPAYVFTLVVFIAGYFVVDPAGGLTSFLLHIFCLNHISDSANRLQVNTAYWSLAVEVQLYLLYPLFYWMRTRWGCGRALTVTFLVCTAGRLIAWHLQDPREALRLPLWQNTQTLWFDWALGAYIAERWFQGERTFPYPWLWAGVFIPLYLYAPFHPLLYPLGFTLGSIVSAVLLDAAMWNPAPTSTLLRFGYDALRSVGIYSYSLYLIHAPPIRMLDRLFGTAQLTNPVLHGLLLGAGATVVLCFLAWMLYRTIEVDGEALGRRLWKKLRPPPPEASPPAVEAAVVPTAEGTIALAAPADAPSRIDGGEGRT